MASIGMAFLMTQVYLLVRVWAKLAWIAGEVVFFQGELAHATYTAAPLANVARLARRRSHREPHRDRAELSAE